MASEEIAPIRLSPLGDPELVETIGGAVDRYMAEHPWDREMAESACVITHRVTKADGIIGFVGTVLVMAHAADGKPLGVYRYADGKIMPGGDLGPERFVRLNN